MKSLLSKLGKTLLIPVLAWNLNTGKVEAQEKSPFEISLNLGFESGVSYSPLKLEPYDNWKSNFEYKEIDRLENKKIILHGDMFLGIEPKIKANSFKVGFPINFYLTQFSFIKDKAVIKNQVYYGDLSLLEDKDRINDIILKKKTPSFGISLGLGKENKFWVEFLTYRYDLIEQSYEDKDFNHKASIFKKNKIEEGWAQKISIGHCNLSIYLERTGNYNEIGISIKYNTKEESNWDCFDGDYTVGGGGSYKPPYKLNYTPCPGGCY
jgi:hypothetical protein